MPHDSAEHAAELAPPDLARLRSIVLLRDAVEGDEGLVYSTWLRSYAPLDFGGSVDGQAPDPASSRLGRRDRAVLQRAYYGYHHDLIERLLERDEVSVICACDPKSPSRVHGWLCSELAGSVALIHYAYVKDLWRRKGLLWLLCEAAGALDTTSRAYTWRSAAAPHVARKLGAEFYPCEEYLS